MLETNIITTTKDTDENNSVEYKNLSGFTGKQKPLTKKDMYDKDGNCILPKGALPRKYQNRSKYDPTIEREKHRNGKKSE